MNAQWKWKRSHTYHPCDSCYGSIKSSLLCDHANTSASAVKAVSRPSRRGKSVYLTVIHRWWIPLLLANYAIYGDALYKGTKAGQQRNRWRSEYHYGGLESMRLLIPVWSWKLGFQIDQYQKKRMLLFGSQPFKLPSLVETDLVGKPCRN